MPLLSSSSFQRQHLPQLQDRDTPQQPGKGNCKNKRRKVHAGASTSASSSSSPSSRRAVIRSCPVSPQMPSTSTIVSDSPGNEEGCSWDCTWDKLPVSAPANRTEFFPLGALSPPASPAMAHSPRRIKPAIKLSLALSPPVSQAPVPPVVLGVPSPITCCTPVSPGLAFSPSRKLRNAKQLSLFVPSSGSGRHSPAPPLSEAQVPTGLDITETRSLPSTPRLAIHTINGTNDSVDGMLDPEYRGELASALKGTMTMKRRTSLPRLSIAATRSLAVPMQEQSKATDIPPTPSIEGSRGLPLPLTVENLVARNREAGAPIAANLAEAHEEFPYQHGPKEILPGLFLGSEQNAKDPAILQTFGISTVLCVAKEVACPWLQDLDCPDISEADEDELNDSSSSSQASDSEREPDLCYSICRTAQSPSLHIPATAVESLQPPRGSPSRPFLIRSSASTPNLQQGFRETTTNAVEIDHQRPTNHCAVASSTPIRISSPHPGYLYKTFAANRSTGRPALSYTKLPWGHDEDDIATHFSTYNICELIDRARADGGRCLVHCQLGVSRSATLMIGYCMRQACLGKEEALTDIKTMHETYSYVRAKSRWVAPNIGLLAQLVQFERVLAANTDSEISMPYTNSAYYDSQLSLASSSSPDNLSPCSTSESELDSRLSTPESRSRFRTHLPQHHNMAVDQHLSPLTAAIRLSPAVESFGSSERKREHRKTFSTDFPPRLSIVPKPVLAQKSNVA